MVRQIQIDGFTSDIAATVDNSIIAAVFGPEGSGKTRFLATMPGPLGVVPCDRKSRATINKEIERLGRKDVLIAKEDFIRHSKPIELSLMSVEKAMTYYGEHVKRIMEAAYKLAAHPDIRAVAVDGGSQLWEDILFKHYGRNQRIMPRDRGPANQDMIDFLAAMTGKHFAITLKSDNKWENDKPTSKQEAKGMRQMGYHVTVVMEMLHNDSYNPEVDPERLPNLAWQFRAQIRHCQLEPLLQLEENGRMQDEFISFQSLAYLIYPEVDQDQFAINS